jgi:putative inorganic carbon (hco3(-)) transporter
MSAVATVERNPALGGDRTPWVGAMLLACVAVASFGFLALSSTKLAIAVIAAVAYVGGALLSGNPRLFCLWGLMVTSSFDLSKRLGPTLAKMGGEASFRIEMSDPFLLALALFLLRDLWTQRRSGLQIPKAAGFWALLILIGCIWGVVGPWRLTAAHEVVRMAKMAVLFVVIANEVQTPRRLLHCAGGLTLAVILQSGVGIVQAATGRHFGLELLGETGKGTIKLLATESIQVGRAFRIGAFLGHPNLFGIFLAALLPLAAAAFLMRRGIVHKIFFLSAIALGTAALIGTMSRSGWLSFVAAFACLVVLLIMHPGTRTRTLLMAIGPATAVLVVCVIFAGPISRRLFGSRDIAMQGRAEYMRDALGLIRARPVTGWGLNSYTFAVPPFTRYGARGARERFDQWQSPVHNIHLLWWAETGLVGMTIHLMLLLAIIRTGFQNLRVRDEVLFLVNAACLSGIMAFMVDGFFSFTLRTPAALRVFFVLAGMIMAVRYCRLREPAPRPALEEPLSRA